MPSWTALLIKDFGVTVTVHNGDPEKEVSFYRLTRCRTAFLGLCFAVVFFTNRPVLTLRANSTSAPELTSTVSLIETSGRLLAADDLTKRPVLTLRTIVRVRVLDATPGFFAITNLQSNASTTAVTVRNGYLIV
jgi:hypothetical protein